MPHPVVSPFSATPSAPRLPSAFQSKSQRCFFSSLCVLRQPSGPSLWLRCRSARNTPLRFLVALTKKRRHKPHSPDPVTQFPLINCKPTFNSGDAVCLAGSLEAACRKEVDYNSSKRHFQNRLLQSQTQTSGLLTQTHGEEKGWLSITSFV